MRLGRTHQFETQALRLKLYFGKELQSFHAAKTIADVPCQGTYRSMTRRIWNPPRVLVEEN